MFNFELIPSNIVQMSTNSDDIQSRIASFQEPEKENAVRCLLCPHACVLKDGQTGICRTRINRQGKLYTLSYGNPCSLAIDPIEKKPLFHFYPGTKILSLAVNGCNFRCLNCQNWEISQTAPDKTATHVLLPEEVVKTTLRHELKSIAFTYTEPTVFYEYVYDTFRLAHEKGLKTVLISNGYINKQPLLDLCPCLDAANIDLKCFDENIHQHLTGGRLQPVLETLKTLKEQGVWLEITNLLIPGFSDNPEMIRSMCHWLVENDFADTPLHFSRFFPAYKLNDLPPTSVNILIQAGEIASAAGMNYVYIGNIPSLNAENTYCPGCKTLLVERRGYIVSQNRIRESLCPSCGYMIHGAWND